jgi:hypothetical protein
MASWQTIFLVKMMTLWNYLTALYTSLSQRCSNFYNYIKDYAHGHHDMWLFVPGHTFPLSLANLSNSISVNWIYDNYDNSLSLATDDSVQINHYRFSWLSAKIQVKHSNGPRFQYEIDNFIENFVVHTVHDVPPSLYIVFMCWCAHTKHWFRANDVIEFHIIDDMAEERILTLDGYDEAFIIKRNKIYLAEEEITEETENRVVEDATQNEVVETEKNKDE